MLAFSISLCLSTLSSSPPFDYAGKACYNSLLSSCVESIILANNNTSTRESMFVCDNFVIFWILFNKAIELFVKLIFVDTISYTITPIAVIGEIRNFLAHWVLWLLLIALRVYRYVCMCAWDSNLYSRGLFGTIPDQLLDLVNDTSFAANL